MEPRRPIRPVDDHLPKARVTSVESQEPMRPMAYQRAVAPPALDPAVDPAEDSTAVRGVQAIYVVFGLVIALLVLRVLLKALAANPGAAFTSFVYAATAPLVAPFQGIFATPTASNGGVLEFSSVVAIVIYALAAWAIVRLIVILGPRQRPPTMA